ncbi:hypothetical protein ACOSQ3_031633 [Xanthoceras sorbifolium]
MIISETLEMTLKNNLKEVGRFSHPNWQSWNLGDDPTEWFDRVDQFFEFQGTTTNQKVSLASFHLKGEANQWWQWLCRSYKEEGREVTWEDFLEELWACFGPTKCKDFDKALLRVKQVGSPRDYEQEFEKLGNWVQGWTQKALVGPFMGGLKSEIADGIRLFKPKSLKEAISLARMRDDQLNMKDGGIDKRKRSQRSNRTEKYQFWSVLGKGQSMFGFNI